MVDDCVFCRVVSGELPSTKFYEDDDFVVIKNIHPVVEGHMLVVTKKHFADFMELEPSLYGNMLEVVRDVVKDENIEDFNLVVNKGRVAGELVEHFHLHILPRKEGDGFEFGI